MRNTQIVSNVPFCIFYGSIIISSFFFFKKKPHSVHKQSEYSFQQWQFSIVNFCRIEKQLLKIIIRANEMWTQNQTKTIESFFVVVDLFVSFFNCFARLARCCYSCTLESFQKTKKKIAIHEAK